MSAGSSFCTGLITNDRATNTVDLVKLDREPTDRDVGGFQLVKKFTPEQCEALVDYKNIMIANLEITIQDILNCLLNNFPNISDKDVEQNNKMVITGRYLAYIRFRTMEYLNTLSLSLLHGIVALRGAIS